jgi:hypothetical protein
MKCWNSAFNAQCSGLTIVLVQVGGKKIYVAAVEALRKKESQDETQFTTKFYSFLSFNPPFNANVLFCRSFLNQNPLCVRPNSGFWCCVCLTLRITLLACHLHRPSWENNWKFLTWLWLISQVPLNKWWCQ